MKKIVVLVSAMVFIGAIALICCTLTGCNAHTSSTWSDVQDTLDIGNELAGKQETPTDIGYSLERYNLIRRTYWVNGMREKAMSVPCPIAEMPLGYIVLLTESGSVVSRFTVDGKVTSLNSYLTPDSEYYESCKNYNKWLPDVDGSYGENDGGIFFFTTDGKYIEWNGTYIYSDIPFSVDAPIIKYEQE